MFQVYLSFLCLYSPHGYRHVFLFIAKANFHQRSSWLRVAEAQGKHAPASTAAVVLITTPTREPNSPSLTPRAQTSNKPDHCSWRASPGVDDAGVRGRILVEECMAIQRESGRLGRIDSRESIRRKKACFHDVPAIHAIAARMASNLRFAIFSPPKRDSQKRGSVREPCNDLRESGESIRTNRAIYLRARLKRLLALARTTNTYKFIQRTCTTAKQKCLRDGGFFAFTSSVLQQVLVHKHQRARTQTQTHTHTHARRHTHTHTHIRELCDTALQGPSSG